MENRVCIICAETKEVSQFNEEHMIPAAIGGRFIIHTVCEECNKHLGKTIDSKLLKNAAILHYRNIFGSTRQSSGSVPNPFKGKFLDSEGKNQYLVDYKDGKLVTQALIKPELYDLPDTDGAAGKITIPADRKHEADEIIRNYLKRKGVENGDYTLLHMEENESKAIVEISTTVDDNTFIFGCVKIAYEAIHYLFPNAFNDPDINTLRLFLKNGELTEALKNILDTGSALNTFYREKLATIEGLGPNHHILLIENVEGTGLVCVVRLYDLVYAVVLSKGFKPFNPGHEIVFVNDCLSNLHRTNFTHHVVETSFQINPNGLRPEIFQKIRDNSQDAFKLKDKIPIHNEAGELLFDDIHHFATALLAEAGNIFPWTVQSVKFDLLQNTYFLKGVETPLVPLLSVCPKIGIKLKKLTNHPPISTATETKPRNPLL